MEPTTVIKMPIITEKVTAASEFNQYAFHVDHRATRTDVKKAIEAIYGVTDSGIIIAGGEQFSGLFYAASGDQQE